MGVKVNPAAFGGIFAVPDIVVDEHIRLAGGQQLKVLLFVLRHNNGNTEIEKIADGVGMTVQDVKDALSYWLHVGVLLMDGEEPNAIVINSSKPQKTAGLHELPDITPTYDQVAARVLEDESLKALFSEVQLKLGRTIGYGDQAKFIMMHDDYGLPVEVILTIVEYCVKDGKPSMGYISKIAKDWGEHEINTLDAADERLRELRSDEKLWKKFVAMFSVDPPRYTEIRFSYLKRWVREYKQSLELIFYAYELMIEKINAVNFKYMDKMLESWHGDGLKKPQDVMQANTRRTDNLNSEKTKNVYANVKGAKKQTSYNSEKVKQKAQGPIEYKRRNNGGE